jgi:LysR family transcriptional regulator, carnitine catabolism transcriptional activator
VAANVLTPAMREFRKQRPHVRVQLFDADLPTLIAMVEAGKFDMSLGIFKPMAGVRREPFFRFSLMVARAAKDGVRARKTMAWKALDGETLISLSAGHPHEQLIDKHVAEAGVKVQIASTVNLLDTQIALAEAEEGIAIIPSFGISACRNRKVTVSQLNQPVAHLDLHLISSRGAIDSACCKISGRFYPPNYPPRDLHLKPIPGISPAGKGRVPCTEVRTSSCAKRHET